MDLSTLIRATGRRVKLVAPGSEAQRFMLSDTVSVGLGVMHRQGSVSSASAVLKGRPQLRRKEDVMAEFLMKVLDYPLFGKIENRNPLPWRQAFAAATSSTPVVIDEAALDLIATQLELDSDGLFRNAQRYVAGEFREKARGLGGSHLGDLGEALTYLVNRAADRNIVRVVGWRAGPKGIMAGIRYPQPDFLIVDNDGVSAALECKSTQVFGNYVDYLSGVSGEKLNACAFVKTCRGRALPQLGYVGSSPKPTTQDHSLKTNAGALVPFPVGRGIAVAVGAIDGRMRALKGAPGLVSPAQCRDRKRDCWHCLPPAVGFVHVTMRNAPDRLRLGGEIQDSGPSWFLAYRRWTDALLAYDPFALRFVHGELVDALSTWLERSAQLRKYWSSYLTGTARQRGLSLWESHDAPSDGAGATPGDSACRIVNLDAAGVELSKAIENGQPVHLAIDLRAPASNRPWEDASMSIRFTGGMVEFQFLSPVWWDGQSVASTEGATHIAHQMLRLAYAALPLDSPGIVAGDTFDEFVADLVRLRAVKATVGEREVELGWVASPLGELFGAESSRIWDRLFQRWMRSSSLAPWQAPPFLGDTATALHVLPSGRAMLRFPSAWLEPRRFSRLDYTPRVPSVWDVNRHIDLGRGLDHGLSDEASRGE